MNQPTKPDSIETECRANCDICFDEVGNEWPCAKRRAAADRAARQPVAGSVDTPEFRRLAFTYAEAIMRGTVPATSKAWEDLIAHINALIAQAAPSGDAVYQFKGIENEFWSECSRERYEQMAGSNWMTRILYTRPAPRDVDAPIVLPEKPKPQCLLPGVYAHTDDTLDNFATAAVLKDRTQNKQEGTK